MKINQSGIDLIKEFEGLELEAYQDVAGIWTIGYGHTADVTEGDTITELQAEGLLIKDLATAEAGVERAVRAPITANQFAAFVSLAFNIGVKAFEGSTALRRFNAGDARGAAAAIEWWRKVTINGKKIISPGLVRRRKAERALFETPVSESSERKVS